MLKLLGNSFGGGALGGKTYFVENVSSGRLLVHTADMPHGSADVCKTFPVSNISYIFLVTVFFEIQYFGISIFRFHLNI